METPHTGYGPTGTCRSRIFEADGGPTAFGVRLPGRLSRRACPGGFTLLEVLVSVLIFSIVVTTIFVSYRSLAAGPERLDDRLAEYEMAKTCLDRMVEDLQSLHCTPGEIYSPPERDDPPDPYRVVGGTLDAAGRPYARLRFTSLAHVPTRRNPMPGLAEIVYYVRESEDGTREIRRSDRLFSDPSFDPSGVDPVLCLNVRSLQFRFFDAAAEAFEIWDSDSSDFENATPRAIGIRIEIGIGDRGREFETMVKLPVYRGES